MGRISKIKRDLIMEANKKLLNETEEGPELNCHWFLTNVTSLDGRIGELHLIQEEPGFWQLKKFSNPNDVTEFSVGTIIVPQKEEIKVIWVEDSEGEVDKQKIELAGKSLDGLAAYNKITTSNSDKYSGNLIFASDQIPSEWGIVRDYQYLHFTKLFLVESKTLPPWLENGKEVKMKKGVSIDPDSYYIKKKLFGKPTYYYIGFDENESYTNKINKCDRNDPGRY
jgi:hypothetical protein